MVTVKEQYGFVPTSVLYFVKDDKLTYGFMGDQSWRKDNYDNSSSSSMSEFNPNLAEFCIKYWSKSGDKVLDPFGGWGTRLFTALRLGRQYRGYEISPSTHADVMHNIEQNKSQAGWFGQAGAYNAELLQYHCGDGIKVGYELPNSIDLIFTCPPYHNIEKYESVQGQLSDIKDYDAFLRQMFLGAKRYYEVLKRGKYCVFVVGDWREDGQLRLFSKDIIDIFVQAGFHMHDLIINKLNSAAVVGCGNFEARGFVTKSHEYVLVFKKPEIEGIQNKNKSVKHTSDIIEITPLIERVIVERVIKEQVTTVTTEKQVDLKGMVGQIGLDLYI